MREIYSLFNIQGLSSVFQDIFTMQQILPNFMVLLLIQAALINPLSGNPINWSNTLKKFEGKSLLKPTNRLKVFDHFVGWRLKG